ncbi:MAG: RNA methyltransferase [Cyanobacteria bacterium J069]|nr:MAG: RNA methyltransferase [Cyanobacteria bacterium J069]
MLTSLQNPLIKQIRKLHQAKGRREQQQFLLEGTHLLQEALAVGYPLAVVCYTEAWRSRYPDLFAAASRQAERLELVNDSVLAAIATTVNPDGVVATAARQAGPSPSVPSRHLSLGLALETVQDPGNLGTMIRTAAAAGADGLWLSADSVDLDHPKVLRATAGQWFRLPMGVTDDLTPVVQAFRSTGGQVIATLPDASQTCWQTDFTQPTLILLGNEGAGLSPALAALADTSVSIPLAAGVESLNVAIAAALLLYEARRQRMATASA